MEQAARNKPSGPQPANLETDVDQKKDLSSSLDGLLLEDSYSFETLIERARESGLNLRELRDQLIEHQQQLQQTSLDLFNSSYDRFFKLSHLIACLAEPIKHVIQPIQHFRDQLGLLCQSHDNYLRDIDVKLAALEETSRNKLLAHKLVLLIRRRDRIFEQIHRLEWLKYPSADMILKQQQQRQQQRAAHDSIAFKVNCDSIERIYLELDQLLREVAAIQPTSDELMPIKRTLESTLAEQQRRLANWFADALHQASQARDDTFISFIRRTYEQRGDPEELDTLSRLMRALQSN